MSLTLRIRRSSWSLFRPEIVSIVQSCQVTAGQDTKSRLTQSQWHNHGQTAPQQPAVGRCCWCCCAQLRGSSHFSRSRNNTHPTQYRQLRHPKKGQNLNVFIFIVLTANQLKPLWLDLSKNLLVWKHSSVRARDLILLAYTISDALVGVISPLQKKPWVSKRSRNR